MVRSAWRSPAPLVVIILAFTLSGAPSRVSAKQFSDWGPASLVTEVNSAQADGCPIESPNGLELFLASTRTGAVGGDTDPNDIWVAQRPSKDAAWGTPQHLPVPVNSAAADFCPTPLNGNGLLFVSSRSIPGVSCGAGDMYITRNNPAHGWEAPTNLGCSATQSGPNFASGEFSPSLVETEQGTLLYFSSAGPSGGTQDIYVSVRRADGSFAPAVAVPELNTAANDQMPNVRRNGLEMVFVSDRTGTEGGLDIYVATRASTADPWSSITNLADLNTSAPESRPSLSGDGERLYFGRGGDIWVSTRAHIRGGN